VRDREFRIALAAVTSVGCALRMVHLDGTAGFDETVNLRRFIQGGPEAIFAPYSGYGSTNNHLINSCLTWAMTATFGVKMWVMRLPAMLLGMLAVPLVGLAGRRLLREDVDALLAALLAALSPLLIAYSPACRGYASMICFAMATIWLLLRVLDRGDRTALAAAVLTMFGVGLSHMSGLIFVGSLGAALVSVWALSVRWPQVLHGARRRATYVIVAIGFAGVVLGAWYSRESMIVEDVYTRVAKGEFVDPSLAGLNSVKAPTATFDWLKSSAKNFFGTDGTGALVWGAAMLVGALVALRRDVGRGTMLLVLCAFPFAALKLGSLTPSPRYFLFVQPFLLMLAGAGAGRVGRELAKRTPLARPLLAGVLVALLVQAPTFSELRSLIIGPGSPDMGVRWNLKGAADHVASQLRPGDLLAPLPEPERRSHFLPVWKFHAQHELAHLLARPATGATRRIWFVTPDGPDAALLPPGVLAGLDRSLSGCQVHMAEIELGPAEAVALPPLGGADGLGQWTWARNIGLVEWSVDTDPARFTFVVGREAASAEAFTPPLAVEPGTVIELSARVSASPSRALRPLGLLGVTFLDAAGERVLRATREAPTRLEDPGQDGWTTIQLAVLVPRTASAMEVSVGLADGNVAGTLVHFTTPTLSVARVRGR
jgi:hypothetical protein